MMKTVTASPAAREGPRPGRVPRRKPLREVFAACLLLLPCGARAGVPAQLRCGPDDEEPVVFRRTVRRAARLKTTPLGETSWTVYRSNGGRVIVYRFLPGGVVRRTGLDDAWSDTGTWRQSGEQIHLRFRSGAVRESGSIRGQSIRGRGQGDRGAYRWTALKGVRDEYQSHKYDSATLADLEQRRGRKIDEMGVIGWCDLKARLDNFAIELHNDPGARGFIVVRGDPARPNMQTVKRRRAAFSADYLISERGFERGRLGTVDGGGGGDLTLELWVVPSEAAASDF